MADSELTSEDMDYIMSEVRGQLTSMSESEKRSVARTRDSFTSWLLNAIRAVGRLIGKVISFPLKAIEAFFEGIGEGFDS